MLARADRLQFRVVIKWLPNSFHNTSSVCQHSYILPSSCNSWSQWLPWEPIRESHLIGRHNSLSCNQKLKELGESVVLEEKTIQCSQSRYWYDGYQIFFFSLMTVNVGNSVLASFLSLVNVQLSILDLGLPSLASHCFLHNNNNNNNNNIIKKMYQITTVSNFP